jgi:lysophospholipase L1-like esterase
VHHKVTTRPANTRDLWRWRLQGLIGDLRQLTPVTPVETYLQTLQQIISSLREHNITPVVISPFVFGGWRSDRIARSAAGQLRQLLASKPDIFYVDAYAALDRHPRRKMLLHDGTHLTLAGQQVVANALLPALKQAVDHRHNTAANSPA